MCCLVGSRAFLCVDSLACKRFYVEPCWLMAISMWSLVGSRKFICGALLAREHFYEILRYFILVFVPHSCLHIMLHVMKMMVSASPASTRHTWRRYSPPVSTTSSAPTRRRISLNMLVVLVSLPCLLSPHDFVWLLLNGFIYSVTFVYALPTSMQGALLSNVLW